MTTFFGDDQFTVGSRNPQTESLVTSLRSKHLYENNNTFIAKKYFKNKMMKVDKQNQKVVFEKKLARSTPLKEDFKTSNRHSKSKVVRERPKTIRFEPRRLDEVNIFEDKKIGKFTKRMRSI